MLLVQILGMPHGADRNVALARWLELSDGESCQVSLGPTVMVVTGSEQRANEVLGRLRPELAGDQWMLRCYQRSDGKWVTYAVEPDAPADSYAVELNRLIPMAAELGIPFHEVVGGVESLRRQIE